MPEVIAGIHLSDRPGGNSGRKKGRSGRAENEYIEQGQLVIQRRGAPATMMMIMLVLRTLMGIREQGPAHESIMGEKKTLGMIARVSVRKGWGSEVEIRSSDQEHVWLTYWSNVNQVF